jgi:hypothetical protein
LLTPNGLPRRFIVLAGLAFRLPTGSFISSTPEGDVASLSGPLRNDRACKLFTPLEAAVPLHAAHRWPLRCSLNTNGGVYVSNCRGKAAVNADTACCSEQFLLDLPPMATTGLRGLEARTEGCMLWTCDGTHLASGNLATGQVLFRSQHSCVGSEQWEAQLLPGNYISFTQPGQKEKSPAASMTCEWPKVELAYDAKPTALSLEISNGDSPALILSAHGKLVSAVRPCGARGPGKLQCIDVGPGLDAACWELNHCGDGLYTICHTTTGEMLHVLSDGGLALRRPEDMLQPFPHVSTMFMIELSWAEVPAADIGAAAAAAGFVSEDFLVTTDDDVVLGFTIRTAMRVDGRHLCLSCLPDGRISTSYAASRPSRWDLFTIADKQAVLQSPLKPLDRLAAQASPPTDEHAVHALRRSSSCQASLQSRSHEHNGLPDEHVVLTTTPRRQHRENSLPNISEHVESKHAENDDNEGCNFLKAAEWDLQTHLTRERRCMSDSMLTDLRRHPPSTPKWLAAARQPPSVPSGWGIISAATVQEQACHIICVEAVLNFSCHLSCEDNVGQSLVEFLSDTLPEEVLGRVLAEASLLTSPAEPTKLSYRHLLKAAAGGHAPVWAEQFVPDVYDDVEDALPEELAESFICVSCRGITGTMLPMDAAVNPLHHRFLNEMERQRFGGVRRRRQHHRRQGDGILAGLRLAKNTLIFLGAVRCLIALVSS